MNDASGGTDLVERIGSKAWRVQVTNDGAIVVLGVRADTDKEYEVLLSTVDSTPLVTDLLNEMVRTHQGKPPRTFSGDAGPNHAKSVPVQPLSTRIDHGGEKPVLVLDFGGTVLKVAIDPVQLQQARSKPQT
jgi:hexokinase